jgi:hypothetical protein
MKKVQYNHHLSLVLNDQQRQIIEHLANRQECTLGCAARFLLEKGINAVGIKV